jgi:hypothetical protein
MHDIEKIQVRTAGTPGTDRDRILPDHQLQVRRFRELLLQHRGDQRRLRQLRRQLRQWQSTEYQLP